jgi:hypothetical protein
MRKGGGTRVMMMMLMIVDGSGAFHLRRDVKIVSSVRKPTKVC